MNFKKLTKIAAVAALLSASIPACAMEKPSPQINLFVQNNTNSDFKVTQDISKKQFTVKAHQQSNFEQFSFPSSRHTVYTNFSFTPSPIINQGDEITASVFLNFENDKVTANAGLDFLYTTLSTTPFLTEKENPNNEYNLFVTLEGNTQNEFNGSTIKLEISSEIR